MCEKSADRFSLPEFYRVKGKLLLASSARNEAEAEACFRQAIDVARAQEAKSLELRASLMLSSALGREQEARRGPRPAGLGLRLVHRRFRHRRSEGREGAARTFIVKSRL